MPLDWFMQYVWRMRKVHAVSGQFALVFFSLLQCWRHFVPFSGIYSVCILLNKVDSRCTAQGIPYLRQLTTWSSEQNAVLSRGASVQVSPARQVDDVTTNITEEAAESSHDGYSHKRTATRVMASYTLPVTRASLFLFKLIQFNAQGLCVYYLSIAGFHGILQQGNVSNHLATDTA
jgi:hypothetical protein